LGDFDFLAGLAFGDLDGAEHTCLVAAMLVHDLLRRLSQRFKRYKQKFFVSFFQKRNTSSCLPVQMKM
jgi:hypothetical protein